MKLFSTLAALLFTAALFNSAPASAESLENIAGGAECIIGGGMVGGAAVIATLPVKSRVVRDGAFIAGAASGCVLGSVAGYYSAAYGAELPSDTELNSAAEEAQE